MRAADRADRIVAGEYRLLGYEALRFGSVDAIDWQFDPVHDKRAPSVFWADVPYLDPACGDHKIIWELNRHQHWMALGRAYWLTQQAPYRDRMIAEFGSWMAANPPLTGINWASMLELGLRSISWIWAMHFFAGAGHDDQQPWLVDMLIGLDGQLNHVEQNLSYYFSPNTHLLGEALALYICGRTVRQLRSAPRWEAAGRRILVHEIHRQIAADGGHCERSTHYHRYTLDFYLLALAVARITKDDAAASHFEEAATRLAEAARLLADDHGRLPHIGDDDGGCLLPLTGRATDDIRDTLATAAVLLNRPDLLVDSVPEETCWLTAYPGFSASLESLDTAGPVDTPLSGALFDTGYYVARSAHGDHLVIDAGAHGFQNGGHAHADALAITLSVAGRPLLIDAGTGCYSVEPALRDRFRSTAVHNTLALDDHPQSVPAGPCHWSHTADSRLHRWRSGLGFDYCEASHDGYSPVEHRRHVFFAHGDLLVVADLVRGDGTYEAAVHWHVDPRWQVTASGRHAVMSGGGQRVELVVPNGSLTPYFGSEEHQLGWHSPVYGRVEPCWTLRTTRQAHGSFWVISVFGLDQANSIREADVMPVWAEAGTLVHSTALRITRASSVDYLVIAEPVEEGRSTWRVAEIETDARVLFCRSVPEGPSRLSLVDGSLARTSHVPRLLVALPHRVADLQLDLSYAPDGSATPTAELSGSWDEAQVQFGGRALDLKGALRPAARPSAGRN